MIDIVTGIDLGGTNVKAIALDNSGKTLYQCSYPTNDGDDKDWKSAIFDTVRDIRNKIQCSKEKR